MSKHNKPGHVKHQESPATRNPEREKESTNRHVYVEPGVEIDIVKSLKEQLKTERAEDQADHKKQLFWTRIAAILVLIYTIVTFWQGWLTREIITAGGEQFRLEHRPYVYVSNFKLLDADKQTDISAPVVGKPLIVNIYFKNVGKTPAINVVTHKHILFGKQLEKFRFEPPDPNGTIGDMFGPDGGAFATAISTVDTFKNETVNIQQQDIVPWDGSQPIYLFGRIAYDDTFGKSYCTPFSMQFLSGGGWALIGELNMNGRSVKSESLCPNGAH